MYGTKGIGQKIGLLVEQMFLQRIFSDGIRGVYVFVFLFSRYSIITQLCQCFIDASTYCRYLYTH